MRLVPLVEARTAFLSKIAPVASAGMASAKAGGLVLAEDVAAPIDIPASTLALQRGYAIASRASVGASSYLPTPLALPLALVEPGDVFAGFPQGIADRTPVAQWRCGTTALEYWPGGFGGSHPHCGRATSLEVTELMNDY